MQGHIVVSVSGVVPRRLWRVTPGALVFQVTVEHVRSTGRFRGTFVGRSTESAFLPLRSSFYKIWLNSPCVSVTFILELQMPIHSIQGPENLPLLGLLAFSFLHSLCHALIHSQNPPLCNCLQLNALHPTSWGCPFLCSSIEKLFCFQV